MRRALFLAPTAAWLLSSACGGGQPAPVAPDELLFAATPSGHAVVQTRSGHTVASLPPGPLAIGLTGGGDVAEAWLLTSSGGGQRLLRLRPSASFAATEVNTEPVAGFAQAGLVPAPLLETFSGQKTVLVTRFGDGSLVGYQNGVSIWRRPPSTADDLRWAEASVYAHDGGGWRLVKPETGDLGPALAAGCEPVASVGGDLAQLCAGSLAFRGQTFAGRAAVPWSAATFDGGAILGWKDGGVARLPASGRARYTQTAAMIAAPVAAPDIDHAYLLASPDAVSRLVLSSGRAGYFATPRAAAALGISRDGNYVYAVGGGRLEVFRSGDGRLSGDYAAEGTAIEYVAG